MFALILSADSVIGLPIVDSAHGFCEAQALTRRNSFTRLRLPLFRRKDGAFLASKYREPFRWLEWLVRHQELAVLSPNRWQFLQVFHYIDQFFRS